MLRKNSRSVTYFYILLHTGLRAGELCALQWKDIDFKRRELHIYKTINRTKCYFDGYEKNWKMQLQVFKLQHLKKTQVIELYRLQDSVAEAFQTLKKQQAEKQRKKSELGHFK